MSNFKSIKNFTTELLLCDLFLHQILCIYIILKLKLLIICDISVCMYVCVDSLLCTQYLFIVA